MPAIDAAVLDAALFQMAPPAIVRPAIDWNTDVATVKRRLDEIDRQDTARLDTWIVEAEARMQQLGNTLAAAAPLDPRVVDRLQKAALIIEERTEEFVIRLNREIKRFRQAAKRAKAISPEMGRIAENALTEAKAFARRETEARLEGALAFRAISSSLTPDNDSGFVVTSPADVDRIFAEAMASI